MDNFISIDFKKPKHVYFKTITGKKGKEIRKKINDIDLLLSKNNHICEVYNFDYKTPIKLFLDIDIKIKKDLNKNIIQVFDLKRENIINTFKKKWYIIDFSRKLNEDESKVSFHLIHKKLAFNDYKSLIKYVSKNFSHVEGMDMMYKSYFLLRAPLQSKWDDPKNDRGRLINCTIEQALITINFKGYKVYEYIDIGKPSLFSDEIYDTYIIKQLLDILPSKYFDDYNLWVKICYALKNLKSERGYDLFIEFSKKSKKYGNGSEANKLWYAPLNNEIDKKITPKSIYYYAKLSNSDKYFDIINPNEYHEKFMSNHGLTYQDFTKKWCNKKIITTNTFLADMRQVIGYYDKGTPIYIFKNKEGFHLSKKHNLNSYHLHLNDKRYTFLDILQINNITSIQYDAIKFKPEKLSKETFNLWSGFQSNPIKNDALIKPILHHIKHIWANNIPERFNYIINWLAHIIQEPWKKNGTVLVLIGAQGCGKNILCNFLMENLIGEKYCTTINDLNAITKRFNCLLEHKLLITLDEVSNIEKNYHKTFDILKSLITEKTQKIERKGIDPITIDDYCNYIMLSNNYYPVKVEGMDRRYAIFDCSNKYIGNRKYFQDLKNVFTQDVANAFIHFLKNIDITNADLSKIPESKIRNELIQRSIPDTLIFLDEFVKDNNGNKIPSTILWEKYCTYCSDEGCKIKKKRVFFILCSRYIKKTDRRINGKMTRCYNCDLDYFREKVFEINHYEF
jgi:hypothetical protein